MVGDCDSGPLVYTANVDDKDSISVMLTFHSSVIEDASPPTCTITWDNHYNLPTQPPHPDATSMESLLPGCFTADSREGYHMTNYWFYILHWSLSGGKEERVDEPSQSRPAAVVSVTFLVAVNRTEDKCIFTSMTPALKPGKPLNQSKDIHVGDCDHGPLLFNITQAGRAPLLTPSIITQQASSLSLRFAVHVQRHGLRVCLCSLQEIKMARITHTLT